MYYHWALHNVNLLRNFAINIHRCHVNPDSSLRIALQHKFLSFILEYLNIETFKPGASG